jgi:hypothetical protein
MFDSKLRPSTCGCATTTFGCATTTFCC